MKILIDGYNLIFECGLHGRSVNATSLAKARSILLSKLTLSIPKGERDSVVVVFDAKKEMLSGQLEKEILNGITVYYSIHFQDADEMIEKLILRHSAPKSLLVVSSDHRLHKAAARRKAKAIDSGDWWDSLDETRVTKPVEESGDLNEDSLLSDDELSQFIEDIDNELGGHDSDWPKFP